MNLRNLFLASLVALGLGSSYAQSAEKAASTIGVVNFASCVTESKYGKQEQENLEAMRGQMTKLVADVEAQLNDIAAKFNDPEFLDGLSPDGEQELKAKYQSLREEHDRYQSQFYQILNQANMKLIQMISSHVNEATDKVAKSKKLSLVVNKDACFSFETKYDITTSVIEEMDKAYEEVQKAKNEVASKEEVKASTN